jgi:dipeptidyl aminopeptidase/acylaminoacyl peptidase
MKAAGTLALVISLAMPALAADNLTKGETAASTLKDWPAGVRDIRYRSAADNTDQPALFYAPSGGQPAPVLVVLHTWSGDYRQNTSVPCAKWCIEKGWVFIHPNFRGQNKAPQATGSELVVQDILSAVDYAKSVAKVDATRIYLVGGSGGGYGTLLMAGRAPQVWTAASAWVPISDLKAWYFESARKQQKYADDIVKSLGGIPNDGTPAEAEAKKRSPLTYLAAAKDLPLAINVGIHDGHTGSVPVSHSLHAFNLLAAPDDRLSGAEINWLTEKRSVPSSLQGQTEVDAAFGAKKILFRRNSKNVTLTVFDGGHEILFDAALPWLELQRRAR